MKTYQVKMNNKLSQQDRTRLGYLLTDLRLLVLNEIKTQVAKVSYHGCGDQCKHLSKFYNNLQRIFQ